MNYIANLNTPLSMIVIGTNLGAINLKEDWYDKLAWSGIFIRNLFFSIVILGILCVLPLPVIAKMTTLIMAACLAAGIGEEFLCRVLLFNLFTKIFESKKYVLVWVTLASSWGAILLMFGVVIIISLSSIYAFNRRTNTVFGH